MFTGIVKGVGSVVRVEPFAGGDKRLRIDATAIAQASLDIGASLCVSGVCLTIVETEAGFVAVDVSARTLADTSLGQWVAGQRANLEPALAAGDALGGHFVTGHVDTVAEAVRQRRDGRSMELVVSIPGELRKFVAAKGSVALDGVSLTVNDAGRDSFSVNLVPHTLKETTLSEARAGSRLNLEVDIIARYAARLLET